MSAELQTVAEYFMTPQLQHALDQKDGLALHIEIAEHERYESPTAIVLETIAAQYLVRDTLVSQKGRLAWFGSEEYAGNLSSSQRLQGFFTDFDVALHRLGSYQPDELQPRALAKLRSDRIASLHRRGSQVLLRHLAAVAPGPADKFTTAGALIKGAHGVRNVLGNLTQNKLADQQSFTEIAEMLNTELDACCDEVMATGRGY